MIYEIKYNFGVRRYTLGIGMAIVVTIFFLWLMQFLIYVAERKLDDKKSPRLIDFVRAERNEEVRTDDQVDAPPPVEALPQADMDEDWDEGESLIAVKAFAPKIETNIKAGSGGQEGDYLPVIKVPPTYPTAARDRGIEGFCVVEYTVTSEGTVRDVHVVESQCSSSLFHRSSLRAAKKFRYKPRIINGVKVEVPGVQNQFTFKLDK
ncbi:MAG: energy transducer TonB [Gammaproteobacteria bacterium]|nr:energy transducer TonB [Pseudomonadota bacterium]MCH9663551.1 energy transducer TonB [Gammaproteobacteria bacterium]